MILALERAKVLQQQGLNAGAAPTSAAAAAIKAFADIQGKTLAR